MRTVLAIALLCGGALAACGEEPLATLPASGTAYRALGDGERLAVAEACRDRAAGAAEGLAAEQLAEVDAAALRTELDSQYRLRREQPRPVAQLCDERLPFVTPGLRLRFDGAENSGDAFTFETLSDRPLRIRGTVDPVPREGTVTARRESGGSRTVSGEIGPDGAFALPAVKLQKIADNSFDVSVHAPPNAPRKIHFSAICLDCLAGGPPPSE